MGDSSTRMVDANVSGVVLKLKVGGRNRSLRWMLEMNMKNELIVCDYFFKKIYI